MSKNKTYQQRDILTALQNKNILLAHEIRTSLGMTGLEHIYYSDTGIYYHIFPSVVGTKDLGLIRAFLEVDRDQALAQRFPYLLNTAVSSGDVDMVDMFVNAGFNPAWKNDQGVSALAMGHASGNRDIIQLLESATSAERDWYKISDDVVSHSIKDPISGYKMTQVFNFAAGVQTSITIEPKKDNEKNEVKYFCDMSDLTYVEKAAKALIRLGGHDHEKELAARRNIKKLGTGV